jgi:hypothetical protein
MFNDWSSAADRYRSPDSRLPDALTLPVTVWFPEKLLLSDHSRKFQRLWFTLTVATSSNWNGISV